jgi:hypothetical protein
MRAMVGSHGTFGGDSAAVASGRFTVASQLSDNRAAASRDAERLIYLVQGIPRLRSRGRDGGLDLLRRAAGSSPTHDPQVPDSSREKKIKTEPVVREPHLPKGHRPTIDPGRIRSELITGTRSEKRGDRENASRRVAEVRVEILERARTVNEVKGSALRAAYRAACAAVRAAAAGLDHARGRLGDDDRRGEEADARGHLRQHHGERRGS